MTSTIAAILIVVVLAAWHLRTRRHASWRSSADARFYITIGHPLVAIAVYFLVNSARGTDWEWAFGNFWAFVAMVCFVVGFNALNSPPHVADHEPTATERGGDDATANPAKTEPFDQRNGAQDTTTRWIWFAPSEGWT